MSEFDYKNGKIYIGHGGTFEYFSETYFSIQMFMAEILALCPPMVGRGKVKTKGRVA